MINKFLADIQIIKNAINTNKLVIFAGAGISIDANVPSWSSLIDKIKNDLDLPNNESDYLKIAQIYFNERQEKEYIEKIRKVLGHKKQRFNEIHEELFELNPEHILTTNFEDLLEQVITKNSLPFSIIKEDKDLPYSNNTKLLVKVHGDLETGNLVFKEDDYLGYSQNHPLLDSFIKSIFSTKVVLFIGYSFNDYNLKQIVQYVRNILGKNFQNAYLLSIEKNIHHSHRQYLKNKGINVINYYDANYTKTGSEKTNNFIYDFLNKDNIYGDKANFIKIAPSLSEKGQLLLNFLRFIRFYDELKISINKDNVLTQIYNSLIRFEELKSLPQDFICKLYPFKSKLENERLIDYTALLLTNEELINLFFNRIIIDDYKINLKDGNDEEQKKIEFIIQKLNFSLIYFVKEKNKDLTNLSDSYKKILYTLNESCNCTKCKYERYLFKESLTEVSSFNISDTSDIKDDMQKAFLNYKFGNYLRAFKMFEEIATKAWETQKFIIYYISKVNMKTLKVFLDSEFQINKKEKKDILERIEDIDIDKLLFHIPYKSNEEYGLLKIIRDDKILNKVKYSVDNYYDKIIENYKLFQNKYSNSVGPKYPRLIYLEIYKLLLFYNENYIIYDKFSEFKDIINKAVEALMISYATDNRYVDKVREFDVDFFELTVPYLRTNKFIKILEEYSINEIKFKEGNLEKVINYSNNFFNSYIEENSYGLNKHPKIIDSQLQKNSFEETTRTVFNNIMAFLSLIELNNKQFDLIKNNIFSFLSIEKILYGDSFKYLRSFLERNYKNLSKKDCELLLTISHKKYLPHERYRLFGAIADVCTYHKYVIIDNIDYAKKIASDIDYSDKNTITVVYLWLMSNKEVQKFYYELIIDKLKTKFDHRLYECAVLYEMIDYNLFFDDYLSYINEINKNNDITKEGYFFENEKPKRQSILFYNSLLFLYKLKIKSTDQRLNKLSKLYDFMKFGIFREQFDLSNFKIEWLYLFDYEIFYNEFKKIKPLKKIIENSLKEKYDEELAEIYTKYFL